MSERAAAEDALAVMRGAADDLEGGDDPEDVARWLRKRAREIQSRLDDAGDDAEITEEEAIDELGGGAATAEIDEDDLFTDGGREQRDDLERIADALELQNALLLQLVQDRERERVQEHPDPDHTGRSDHAIATDVVDAYGDLYGGSVAGWEFDPVSDQVENMGDER